MLEASVPIALFSTAKDVIQAVNIRMLLIKCFQSNSVPSKSKMPIKVDSFLSFKDWSNHFSKQAKYLTLSKFLHKYIWAYMSDAMIEWTKSQNFRAVRTTFKVVIITDLEQKQKSA